MVKDVGGWVTGNPKLCKHPNAYTSETVGTEMCPDCNSMRIGLVRNIKTGEERRGWNAVLSGEEGRSGEWKWGEEWIPNAGKHRILNAADEARRQRMLNRAFGADDSDYGEY